MINIHLIFIYSAFKFSLGETIINPIEKLNQGLLNRPATAGDQLRMDTESQTVAEIITQKYYRVA